MANVTVSSTIDTLLQSADAAEAKTAISAATAGSVSALSSNALVLAEKEWPIKTVTWATNQTLTYTGGTDTAGDGVIIQANVTTQFVLTVTPTSSTIYRNGAVTSLSGTITVPVGKHRFVFWTPDDGTTLYMEDTVFAAVDVPVAATPTNYTAATPDVEAHLAGIDTALASAGGAGVYTLYSVVGSTGTAKVASSTTMDTVMPSTITIPANLLSAGTMLRVLVAGTYLNNTGSSHTLGAQVKLGSTTMWEDASAASALSSTATVHPARFEFEVYALGTSSQVVRGVFNVASAGTTTTGVGDMAGSTSFGTLTATFYGTASEDSTGSLTLDCRIQHDNSSANQAWFTHFVVVEVVPSP